MLNWIKSLRLRQKAGIFLGLDMALIPVALVITALLQPQPLAPLVTLHLMLPILTPLLGLAAVSALFLGLPYIRLNAYERRAVLRTAVLAALTGLAAGLLGHVAAVPAGFGFYVIFAGCFFLLSAASRLVLFQIVSGLYRRDEDHIRVLIYGAGATGMQLASALNAHKHVDPIAFVDDNPALHGLMISGLPVKAPVRLPDLVASRGIDRILLAMPSLSEPKQAQLARRLEKTGVEVQALPSFAQLIGEEELVDKLAPVVPQRFLGRSPVSDELDGGCDSYADRVVLISGAGGSIGAELCRQVLACRPAKLVLYELNELALYTVHMELQAVADSMGATLVPVLGSVTDPRQVRGVLAAHGVDVVLHAAAYKHVPLVEANPLAGIANNVLGAHTLAREALAAGVERFILISSDKAVRPTNVMGASKRLAELVVQDMAGRSPRTVFGIVRFGNVLGSSGSVVQLFRDQIRRGGPVTVTDPRMTRYFMTLHEAVRLVLLAGSMASGGANGGAKGGEVFVLDMGTRMPIVQLARQMIEAAGYSVRDAHSPEGDIEIVFTGLRPGEKLYEELTLSGVQGATAHPKIFSAREAHLSEIEVATFLRSLKQAVAAGDTAQGLATLRRWVDGYGAGQAAPMPAPQVSAPQVPAPNGPRERHSEAPGEAPPVETLVEAPVTTHSPGAP